MDTNEIFNILTIASVASLAGGGVFAFFFHRIHPFFMRSLIPLRKIMTLGVFVLTLFWVCWAMPITILFIALNRPIVSILVVSFVYLFYVSGYLVVTYLKGRKRGW